MTRRTNADTHGCFASYRSAVGPAPHFRVELREPVADAGGVKLWREGFGAVTEDVGNDLLDEGGGGHLAAGPHVVVAVREGDGVEGFGGGRCAGHSADHDVKLPAVRGFALGFDADAGGRRATAVGTFVLDVGVGHVVWVTVRPTGTAHSNG